jgi:His/Glu/Gln/Arg/opine family amino acid ABC transporter permease subunit
MDIIDLLFKYREALLKGLGTTLYLSLMIWIIGIISGTIIGIISGNNNKLISFIAKTLSTLISGVPILVLLYWMYYPMQQILEVEIDPLNIAIIAFSFVNTFIVADAVRQGISSMPKHFTTTGIVSGLSKKTIFFKIQFPLIFRSLIGPILFIQITMLHNSIFASLINVDDIFRQIQRINALEYKPIELYSILALFFLIITLPLNLIAMRLKKRFTQNYI